MCQQHVGRINLVWDHCHECGGERGWICNHCNIAMTEHIIDNWDAATEWLFTRHECTPRLFELPYRDRLMHRHATGETRTLHLGQGPNDHRTVRISAVPGYVTIEQFAIFLGITPGTARDIVHGRLNKMPWAQIHGRTILLSIPDALNYITERLSTQ